MLAAPTISGITAGNLPRAQIAAAYGVYVQDVYAVGQVDFLHHQPNQDPRRALEPTPQDFVDNHRGYLASFKSAFTGNESELKHGVDRYGFRESAAFAVRRDASGEVHDVFAVHPTDDRRRARVTVGQHGSHCAADSYRSRDGKEIVMHSSTVYADAEGSVRTSETLPSLTSQPHKCISSHIKLERLNTAISALKRRESKSVAAAEKTQKLDNITNAIMYVGAYFMSSNPNATLVSMSSWQGDKLVSAQLVWRDGDFFTADGKRWSEAAAGGVLHHLTILTRGEKDIQISSGFTKPDGLIHISELNQFESRHFFSALSQELSRDMRENG